MRTIITVVVCFFILIGSQESGNTSMFEENGNLKKIYIEEMQKEWCKHNEGREIAVDRCE